MGYLIDWVFLRVCSENGPERGGVGGLLPAAAVLPAAGRRRGVGPAARNARPAGGQQRQRPRQPADGPARLHGPVDPVLPQHRRHEGRRGPRAAAQSDQGPTFRLLWPSVFCC